MKSIISALLPMLLLWSATATAIPEGPQYPSVAWTQREAQNYAKILEAPQEELANSAFMQQVSAQSLTNISSYIARDTADPSWLLASSASLKQLLALVADPASLAGGIQQSLTNAVANPQQAIALSLNTPLTPLCTSYALVCAGDPYRYVNVSGPDGADFYNKEAIVTPIVFYDSGCARLSGRIWQPRNIPAGTTLPAVVIDNGSVQAPQPLYWWAAQLLVRNGYVVMTFDPRGQGRSDMETPSGGQGTNIDPTVFWLGLVNAIDFFRSSPATPYPNNAACANTYPTAVTAYNPAYAAIDPDRLGIAGHSLGAIGVSVVQGYGATGADPWPGKLDKTNPVKVAVAWDGALQPGGGLIGGAASGGGVTSILNELGVLKPGFNLLIERGLPKFGIRVPMMDQASEYGLIVTPFLTPPDPEGEKSQAFDVWKKQAVPVFAFTIQGSTHLDFSPGLPLPATSWCPDTSTHACRGGYGQPMIQYYTLAWFDRWLKKPGESGYDTADARLLDDSGAQGAQKMSFYSRSARDFPDRQGVTHDCEDIRADCKDTSRPYVAAESNSTALPSASAPAAGGGAFDPRLLLGLLLLCLCRQRRSGAAAEACASVTFRQGKF